MTAAATTTAPVAAPIPIAVVTVDVPLTSLTNRVLVGLILRKWGYTAPGGWVKSELVDAFNGLKFPRSGKAKNELTKLYQSKASALTGTFVVPPKGWTCEKLATVAAAAVLTLPRGKSAPGGLTVAAARKLLTEAVRAGTVSADDAKGRSKWDGDTVKAFVLSRKLNVAVSLPVAA